MNRIRTGLDAASRWGRVGAAMGLALGLVAGVAEAKTHEINMTAVETDIVIDSRRRRGLDLQRPVPGPVVRVTERHDQVHPDESGHEQTSARDGFPCGGNRLPEKLQDHQRGRNDHPCTFVAKKPGIFFYHCGAPPMIQHVARACSAPSSSIPRIPSLAKADREYVSIQSEYYKNPDDVQAMFDRKFDGMMFNGGIFSTTRSSPAAASSMPSRKRVRIYFVNAGPNEFSAFHPIGEIWDNVYESGNPANNLKGVQTYVVGPGSAATFDVVVESAGAYPLVTHSLTGALRGAIAVLLAGPDAKAAPLMPMVPWELPAK
ncbi:MAG: nitrite reductase [Nitrospiraceae bacterium]